MKPNLVLRTLYLALLALPLAALAAAPPKPWDKNYADNPSAEDDANRDGSPDGWQGSAFKSPAKVVWDHAVAHSGKASLRISDSLGTGNTWQDNSGRWITTAKRGVLAGEKYTLGLWIKTQDVTGSATACISWWKNEKWLAETYTKRLTGTSDWTFVTVTATAPADATAAQVYLCLSNSKGAAWFDDISMVRGTAVSPEHVAEAAPPPKYEVTDRTTWYPFTFSGEDTNLDSLNLTHLLDAPAGKHGFLSVRPDGHFYFADGVRARFWGANLVGAGAFPTKEQAPAVVARLAKYGINLVRIHAVDAGWGIGLIDYSKGDTRHLSAEGLDRLDYLLAQCKAKGIYLYFDLLDYRRFQPADGVKDADKFEHGWNNSIKAATIYNDRLLELQQEFAEQFLTHRNPYTNLRYVDDPAVAVVEITNENSVFYFQHPTLTLPSYVEELKQRWNRWLLERYHDRAGLAKAWTNPQGVCDLADSEDPATGTVGLPLKYLYQEAQPAPPGEHGLLRVGSMVRFLYDLERRYYDAMRTRLRTAGLKVPITGTNQTFCPASVYADAANDFVARNNYWLHPNQNAKPHFTFRNQSVLQSDLTRINNPVVEVASSTVAGKPMIVPEYNWPWPNEYRAECLPLMAAYGCLQDWDGLLFFSYHPGKAKLEQFGNQSDPVRWGLWPAMAMLYMRQDVAAAKQSVLVQYDGEEMFAGGPNHGKATGAPFRQYAYVSKIRNRFDGGAAPGAPGAPGAAQVVRGRASVPAPAAPEGGYRSDTGELQLDPKAGLFTIRTPRTQGAVGFLSKQGRLDLGSLTLECRTPFAAIMVTSLDGQAIARSRHLLLTAVSRAENTGQAFDLNHTRVPEQGQPPVLVEPVDADLTLQVSGAARVYPLDETGKRREALKTTGNGVGLRVQTVGAKSPWCEVVVE